VNTSSMERVETASVGAAIGYHRDSPALGHWVVTTRPSSKFTAVPGCRRRSKTEQFRRSKSERFQSSDSCSALMLGRVSTPRSRRR